ncbi:MAG TPA: carboxypeptidase regulatory-like domain-containing protein, partial [Longimicrobium sp.]|nr:carboxypeptidase regulatory-like domain-containing protein [Longimicrobium sp.]
RAPAAGRYSVRAERIGYSAVTSPAFDLGSGETRTERLVASGAAVTLQGITVTPAARRCEVRPGAGLATATLWEEARKALNAAALSQSERMFRYDLNQWTREIDPSNNTVRREDRRTATGMAELPFRSLRAAELSRRGYVQTEAGDSVGYWGPDAAVMLSNEFLTDHCLRVVEGNDPRLIGLGFEPVRGRRVADIRGTLWLDRRSAELRRVEYTYQGGPPESDDPRVGGTVEYERLANGPWIVRRWTIRMPQVFLEQQLRNVSTDLRNVRLAGGRVESRISALVEAGGEVTGVRGGDGRPVFAGTARPFVRGTVWDSTRAAPLAGAQVYLSGTSATATAGPDGAFVLQAPGEGRYTVAFSHPELGPLASTATSGTVTLKPGDTATVALSVPGWPTARRALCADSLVRHFSGVVYGRVTGPGAEAATVTGSWFGASGSDVNPAFSRSSVASRPDAQGFYVLCGVTTQVLVTVRAQSAATRGQAEVRASGGVPVRADVQMGAPGGLERMSGVREREVPAAPAAGATAPAGVRTMAVLTRDAAGVPLGRATVRIGTLPAVQTDDEGRARAAALPPGEYPVTMSHATLGELRGRVTVGAGVGDVEIRPDAGSAAGRLTATAHGTVALAGVQARSAPRSRALETQGFYARRERGNGIFLTDSVLQGRSVDRVTDVLRRVEGVRIMRFNTSGQGRSTSIETEYRIASTRNTTAISRAGPCWMDVYVDGQMAQSHDHPEAARNLDQIALRDVQAVEVYRGGSEVPTEYRGSTSACGVILIWTRR